MKTWFAKLRISTAIDSGKSLPPPLQRQIAQSEVLKRFHQDVRRLDQTLRDTGSPIGEAPANLHASIMSAVRHQATASHSKSVLSMLRWLPAPALAVLLIWAIVHLFHTASDPGAETFASTISSLNRGMEMAQTTPQDFMAPLSDELQRLNRDVEEAKSFLMASLP